MQVKMDCWTILSFLIFFLQLGVQFTRCPGVCNNDNAIMPPHFGVGSRKDVNCFFQEALATSKGDRDAALRILQNDTRDSKKAGNWREEEPGYLP